MAAVYLRDLHLLKQCVHILFIILRQQKPIRETMSVKLLYHLVMVLHKLWVHTNGEPKLHQLLWLGKCVHSLFKFIHEAIVEKLVINSNFLKVHKSREQILGTCSALRCNLLYVRHLINDLPLKLGINILFKLTAANSFFSIKDTLKKLSLLK